MSLPDDLLELFTSEYAALENLVNALNFDSELPVNEIVEVYYQITSLSSLITVVKSQLDKNNDAVLRAEKFISEKFNSAIHPKIMEHIETLISDITGNLQLLILNKNLTKLLKMRLNYTKNYVK